VNSTVQNCHVLFCSHCNICVIKLYKTFILVDRELTAHFCLPRINQLLILDLFLFSAFIIRVSLSFKWNLILRFSEKGYYLLSPSTQLSFCHKTFVFPSFHFVSLSLSLLTFPILLPTHPHQNKRITLQYYHRFFIIFTPTRYNL